MTDTQRFLNGPAKTHWERIGVQKRSGVCVPLFSLRSGRSVGVGEIPDIKFLVDWCGKTGMSIIQLLPLNDVGFDFAPYSAKSSFALDPMYLSLERLAGVDNGLFEKDVQSLRERFPKKERVDYGIKAEKLALLKRIFEKAPRPFPRGFDRFRERTAWWLRDDALYKTLKDRFSQRHWEQWDEGEKRRDPRVLEKIVLDQPDDVEFHEWLQWQLFDQMSDVQTYAREHGVLIMGDTPFLVSRDSADVWAHPHYFKLDRLAGAPPDLYFAGGQRWGMPPYHWEVMAEKGYDYLVEKLRYAENFFHLYRVDHVIGVFRLFTIAGDSPLDRQGLDGVYDPSDERAWEDQGRRLLTLMLNSTTMLPCGEDLGVVPACSYKVLDELSIPGLDIPRWTRDWNNTWAFKGSDSYRVNSVVVCSTHDMANLAAWWTDEAGTVDSYFIELLCQRLGLDFGNIRETVFDPGTSNHGRLRWRALIRGEDALLKRLGLSAERGREFLEAFRSTRWEQKLFWNYLGLTGRVDPRASPRFIQKALEKAGEAASIFSVQLWQDWLRVWGENGTDPWEERVNLPGSVNDRNWSVVMKLTLEELLEWPGNETVATINKNTGRC